MSWLRFAFLVEIPSNDRSVLLSSIVCPAAKGFSFKGKREMKREKDRFSLFAFHPSFMALTAVERQEHSAFIFLYPGHLLDRYKLVDCDYTDLGTSFRKAVGVFQGDTSSRQVRPNQERLVDFRTRQSGGPSPVYFCRRWDSGQVHTGMCIRMLLYASSHLTVVQVWEAEFLLLQEFYVPLNMEGNLESPLETKSNHAFWLLRNKEIEPPII